MAPAKKTTTATKTTVANKNAGAAAQQNTPATATTSAEQTKEVLQAIVDMNAADNTSATSGSDNERVRRTRVHLTPLARIGTIKAAAMAAIEQHLEQIKLHQNAMKEIKATLIHMQEVEKLLAKQEERRANAAKRKGGFDDPVEVPENIRAFLNANCGVEIADGQRMSRMEVSNLIYRGYIEKNNLYAGVEKEVTTAGAKTKVLKGKQVMRADAKLAKLFNTNAGEIITFYDYQGFITRAYGRTNQATASTSA